MSAYTPKALDGGSEAVALAGTDLTNTVTIYTATNGATIKRFLASCTFAHGTSSPSLAVKLNIKGTGTHADRTETLKTYSATSATMADIMTTPFTGPLWITPGSTITATATRSGVTGGDNTLTLHLLMEGIEVS